MKKMPTLFVRKFDEENPSGTPKHGSKFTLTEHVTPGCEWVLAGEGVATRKWDGTCILVDEDGQIWKRYDAKHGKTPPERFEPAQNEPDPITGHWPGWLPLEHYPDRWIQEAVSSCPHDLSEGTFEAIGPKINGNKDQADNHRLHKHGDYIFTSISNVPLTFENIGYFLSINEIEGIVFHHRNGIMCKIKRSDFGLKW
jgi:hypothetical protein